MTIDAPTDLSATATSQFARRPASLELDPDKYMSALDELEMSEAQKVKLLGALWGIMRSFVELGVSSDLSARVLHDAGLLPATTNTEGSE